MAQPTSSPPARIALGYITSGALLLVWTVIWYLYLGYHPPATDTAWFICYGLLFTGGVLVVIGLAIGHIGRAARAAETAPPGSQAPNPNPNATPPSAPAQVVVPAPPPGAAPVLMAGPNGVPMLVQPTPPEQPNAPVQKP